MSSQANTIKLIHLRLKDLIASARNNDISRYYIQNYLEDLRKSGSIVGWDMDWNNLLCNVNLRITIPPLPGYLMVTTAVVSLDLSQVNTSDWNFIPPENWYYKPGPNRLNRFVEITKEDK